MGALGAGLLFLLNVAFEVAKFFLLLRLLMEFARVDFFNPIAQSIARITSPALKPFRFIPHIGNLNMACFTIYLGLHVLQLFLNASLVNSAATPSFFTLLTIGLASSIHDILVFWMVVVIIRVILSWLPILAMHPIASVIIRLASPVLRPAARIVPNLGGIDISPIVALVALQFLDIVIVGTLINSSVLP